MNRADYIDMRFHVPAFEHNVDAVLNGMMGLADVRRAWRPMVAFESGHIVWRQVGIDWFMPLAVRPDFLVEQVSGIPLKVNRHQTYTMTLAPIKRDRVSTRKTPKWQQPCGGRETTVVVDNGDLTIGLFWTGNYKDCADETGDLIARAVANQLSGKETRA